MNALELQLLSVISRMPDQLRLPFGPMPSSTQIEAEPLELSGSPPQDYKTRSQDIRKSLRLT